ALFFRAVVGMRAFHVTGVQTCALPISILGDPNGHYRRWAPITPTKEVSDDFRAFRPIDVPVLMVQGDMDVQTPWENARDQEPWRTEERRVGQGGRTRTGAGGGTGVHSK